MLDIKYWGLESLSKIGSILGVPIKTDRFTKDRLFLHYARLLVEMPIAGPFPKFIEFFNADDELIRQEVKYEWKPIKCTHCHMLGHEAIVCRKKSARLAWGQKVPGPVSAPPQGHASSANVAPLPHHLEPKETSSQQGPRLTSSRDKQAFPQERSISPPPRRDAPARQGERVLHSSPNQFTILDDVGVTHRAESASQGHHGPP